MLDDRENPYASPHAEAEPVDGSAHSLTRAERKALDVGAVVIAWEKRRVWYNAVLVVASSPLVFALVIGSPSVGNQELELLIVWAIIANVFYLAGPIVEGYWTWFWGPTKWLRPTLFFVGTLFATSLALTAVTGVMFF